MVEKKNNPPQNRAIFLAFIPPVKEKCLISSG